MSRESRILLFVVVFALLGVLSLGWMAHRYSKILGRQQTGASPARRPVERGAATRMPSRETLWGRQATARALGEIDAFIRVRRAMRPALERGADPPGQAAVDEALASALKQTGVDPEVYAKVRGLYRGWLAGRLPDSTPTSVAFERRRDALRSVHFGEYEPLDS